VEGARREALTIGCSRREAASVKLVRCFGRGNRLHRLRQIGRIDPRRARKSSAGNIAHIQQRAAVSGDLDIADVGVPDVRQKNTFAAGARDVRKRQSIERFLRSDPRPIHQDGNISDPHIGETEVADGGNPGLPGDRELVLLAAAEEIEAEEPLLCAGDFENRISAKCRRRWSENRNDRL
jgi:hypothetical protein